LGDVGQVELRQRLALRLYSSELERSSSPCRGALGSRRVAECDRRGHGSDIRLSLPQSRKRAAPNEGANAPFS
jgi:hypothetical protein